MKDSEFFLIKEGGKEIGDWPQFLQFLQKGGDAGGKNKKQDKIKKIKKES